MKGNRVQNVVQELRAKDRYPLEPDQAKYICSSLARPKLNWL
jgi:hypothetical protein